MPQVEIEEQVVEVPVAKHVQVPMIQKVQKSVDVPQIEYEDQAGETHKSSCSCCFLNATYVSEGIFICYSFLVFASII